MITPSKLSASLLSQYNNSAQKNVVIDFTLSKIFLIIIFEDLSHLNVCGEEITNQFIFNNHPKW